MSGAPRTVHPAAWWLWAIALGAATVRTTNPFLLLLLAGVAWFTVASRRIEAPWAWSIRSFAILGLVALVLRMLLQALFGPRLSGHTLFALPAVGLPDWAAGVSLGGPVTAEAMLLAFYLGLQLAVLLICVGAANSLSSPYRLLRSTPAVLYEAGVAVTVALAFAPLASASARQVHEARRLRGRPHRGPAGLRGVALPVLESALDRSLNLAASMDARGYGRSAGVATARRRLAQGALLVGLMAMLIGVYGLLDAGGGPAALGLPALAFGFALLAVSLLLGGARSPRTRYRPDPWGGPEWLTVLAGAAALAGLLVVGSRQGASALNPSPYVSLRVPGVPAAPTVAVLAAALPALFTPEPAP